MRGTRGERSNQFGDCFIFFQDSPAKILWWDGVRGFFVLSQRRRGSLNHRIETFLADRFVFATEKRNDQSENIGLIRIFIFKMWCFTKMYARIVCTTIDPPLYRRIINSGEKHQWDGDAFETGDPFYSFHLLVWKESNKLTSRQETIHCVSRLPPY